MAVITDQALEQKLLHIHTAFIGEITKLGENCETACVQPLELLKPIGKSPMRQALLSDIPVLEHCRYRIVEEERQCLIEGNSGCSCSVTSKVSTSVSVNPDTGVGSGTGTATGTGTVNCSCREETRIHLKKEPIQVGEIVLCVCCDRDNTETRKGKEATPKLGHHSIKDAIVVGIIIPKSGGGSVSGGGSGSSGSSGGGGSGSGESGGSYDDTAIQAAIKKLQEQAHTHENPAILNAITAAFTTELKSNYDKAVTHANSAHAPSDAEKNAIVGIQLNGTDLTIDSNRKVNITVETGGGSSGSSVTVDSALSTTSTNPVQNKVVTAALNGKADISHTHSEYATADHTHTEYGKTLSFSDGILSLLNQGGSAISAVDIGNSGGSGGSSGISIVEIASQTDIALTATANNTFDTFTVPDISNYDYLLVTATKAKINSFTSFYMMNDGTKVVAPAMAYTYGGTVLIKPNEISIVVDDTTYPKDFVIYNSGPYIHFAFSDNQTFMIGYQYTNYANTAYKYSFRILGIKMNGGTA